LFVQQHPKKTRGACGCERSGTRRDGTTRQNIFRLGGVFDGSRWQYPGDYGSYGINAWCYNPEELNYGDQAGLDHLLWRSTNVKGMGNAPLLLDAIWIGGWPQHSDDPPPDWKTEAPWMAHMKDYWVP